MERGMLAAVISLVLYGLWGFFPKLAMQHIGPASALVYEVAGALAAGLVGLVLVGFRPEVQPQGILFAVLTGFFGMAGTLFYFAAASRSKISVVVSLTALYPLITILLARLLLAEPLTLKQLCGIGFALLAILLFAG